MGAYSNKYGTLIYFDLLKSVKDPSVRSLNKGKTEPQHAHNNVLLSS